MKPLLLPALAVVCSILPMNAEVPLIQTPVVPVTFERRDQTLFIDFGRAAFGNLEIDVPSGVAAGKWTVRVGEKLASDGRIDRKPPGSVNFRELTQDVPAGGGRQRLQIPSKPFHLTREPVKMPAEIGEITPFRYVEIEGAPESLSAAEVRQIFVHAPFDDNAGHFECSDPTLNAVWELCHYTMKATTPFGVYIDGERERIPYEGDAYINMLSHYACDLDPRVARATFDHLMRHPTWPTEWQLHIPMIAAADYEATGDPAMAAADFEALKKKLLQNKAREDGLLVASAIVDWPSAERDGYNEGVVDPAENRQIGPMVNTVANAFYYHALRQMVALARATGREEDAKRFEAEAGRVYTAFNNVFFDSARGIYIDGEGSSHASLHANMFPLAFGLVPASRVKSVTDFVESRGMHCSVYGAQYLLEALYLGGRAEAALRLMTSRDDRSWWHMIEQGSTMTLEAWNPRAKGNLTWNHAWGAAPANITSRYILGVRPLTPGYGEILIAPQPASLEWAKGRVPTPHGPVFVDLLGGSSPRLEVVVPEKSTARIVWPYGLGEGQMLALNGKPAGPGALEKLSPGRYVLELLPGQPRR